MASEHMLAKVVAGASYCVALRIEQCIRTNILEVKCTNVDLIITDENNVSSYEFEAQQRLSAVAE